MPRWLIMVLVILGCTAVPFVFVWGMTQRLGEAFRAWRQFVTVLLVLASPAILIGLWTVLFHT